VAGALLVAREIEFEFLALVQVIENIQNRSTRVAEYDLDALAFQGIDNDLGARDGFLRGFWHCQILLSLRALNLWLRQRPLKKSEPLSKAARAKDYIGVKKRAQGLLRPPNKDEIGALPNSKSLKEKHFLENQA